MQRIDTLGQLAAAITHEYNNTIGVILHSSAMLLEEEPGDDGRAHAERIQRAATRARQFTQQLATFGRVRSLHRAPLDCDAMLTELQAGIAEQCRGGNVTLDWILGSAPAQVVVDRGQFEVLLRSLIANARDAMPEGGVLRLVTELVEVEQEAAAAEGGTSAGTHLALMIADSGAGISAEAFEHLFEPFYSTKPRAMGLGLAAVYAITRAAGGFVRADNRAEGGACFTVLLPVVRGEEIRPA